jgi:hypothetical protein
MSIVRVLFGAGTWGAGGNLVAWVLCGGLAFGWSHVKAVGRHKELMAQSAAQHEDMKQHVTDTVAATPPTVE